jgi:hypothetical protein
MPIQKLADERRLPGPGDADDLDPVRFRLHESGYLPSADQTSVFSSRTTASVG